MQELPLKGIFSNFGNIVPATILSSRTFQENFLDDYLFSCMLHVIIIVYKKCIATSEKTQIFKNMFLTSKLFRKVICTSNQNTAFQYFIFQKQPLGVFWKKKSVIKNFANFTGKHLYWSIFLTKLQTWDPATLLKRDSNTGAFLLNFCNFKEHLFWRTSVNDCF